MPSTLCQVLEVAPVLDSASNDLGVAQWLKTLCFSPEGWQGGNGNLPQLHPGQGCTCGLDMISWSGETPDFPQGKMVLWADTSLKIATACLHTDALAGWVNGGMWGNGLQHFEMREFAVV